jgi:hypothetical protein
MPMRTDAVVRLPKLNWFRKGRFDGDQNVNTTIWACHAAAPVAARSYVVVANACLTE